MPTVATSGNDPQWRNLPAGELDTEILYELGGYKGVFCKSQREARTSPGYPENANNPFLYPPLGVVVLVGFMPDSGRVIVIHKEADDTVIVRELPNGSNVAITFNGSY